LCACEALEAEPVAVDGLREPIEDALQHVSCEHGEINRKRRDGDLVSYFGFTFPKTMRIFDEYRRSYPDGRLHIYTWMAFALAMLGLGSFAVCSRIIPVMP
jgi:hypothetical protein